MQLISGVNTTAYWNSMFLLDYCSYLISACSVILIFIVFDVEAFYKDTSFVCVLTILLLYGLAAIPQTYMLSFVFDDANKALLWGIATYATSGFVYFFVSFLLQRFGGSAEATNDYLQYLFLLWPQYCISMGLYNLWEDYWLRYGHADPWTYDNC